jgi:hypothetical protein
MKLIHLSYCAQHEKVVVEEFLIRESIGRCFYRSSPRNKKKDEGNSAAAGSLPPVHTTIQIEDKDVNFTAVTFLTSTLISYA